MTASPKAGVSRRVAATRMAALAWLASASIAPAAPAAGSDTAAFDHGYADWTALLRRHVVVLDGGRATRLRYAALKAGRAPFDAVLQAFSAVDAVAFASFGRAQQQAFLINAYNAFTIELILTKYPALESIKDLGSLLSSPWKPQRIELLGRRVSLDDIEHGMLRARGRYDDPRVHFAVNCASVGLSLIHI